MHRNIQYCDREAALEAVKKNGDALEHASEDLKADHGVVLEAVKKNGYALRYASEDLKADHGVVLEAVKQNGNALRYASADLRSSGSKGLKAYVQGELTSAKVLAGTFLCAAALPKHADRGAAADTTTCLEMLSTHGPHHGSLFKKRFAAFAGVPTAARLALLKAVASKLGM